MLSLVLAAALAFSRQDARSAYEEVSTFVTNHTPREAGTARGRLAANFICDSVAKAGLSVRRDEFSAETPAGPRRFTNVYGEFASGETKPWVVLVSHYDTKRGLDCPGANDGASTSALLMAMSRALVRQDAPKGNVLLVWTDGEECFVRYGANDGLWGSRRAAEYIRGRKDMKIRAVICLDMLGDADLRISVPSNGSDSLAEVAVQAAKRIGEPELVLPVVECVTDDHVPFLTAGFEAIDLIDFEYGPANSYWHTKADTIERISEESLLKAGRLVAEMLGMLLRGEGQDEASL